MIPSIGSGSGVVGERKRKTGRKKEGNVRGRGKRKT